MIGFVERELSRISAALREPRFADQYDRLYAAQQALAWVLEPEGFRSPYAAVTGTPEGSGDCSAHLHPLPS
jgi:hypothetical protein